MKHVVLKPASNLYNKGHFKVLGNVLATMIAQEGPPLTIFTKSMAMYLTTGNVSLCKPTVDDISDRKVAMDLKKVHLLLLNGCE